MRNLFKERLKSGPAQIGLWLAMADAYAASIAGHAGFDWLVIDGEHGPNDLRSTLHQLMALEAAPSSVVVRPPMDEKWYIKQLLDIGCQTLLIPMVEARAQAEAIVRSVRYPQKGGRGMGAAIARSSRFSTIQNYIRDANESVCLLVQIETQLGIENLDAIAATEGVDGVFIGPADLAADLGHSGQIGAPAVQRVIESALRRLAELGVPSGVLTFDPALNKRYLELGARFVAVGADVTAFSLALQNLRQEYVPQPRSARVSAY